MPYATYQKTVTEKKLLSTLVEAFAGSTMASESASTLRGVRRRRFTGGVAYNRVSPSTTITIVVEVTDGTTSYQLDRVTILPGESHVWNEKEFGVDLANDQYISVTATKSFGVNDKVYLFLRFQDMYS